MSGLFAILMAVGCTNSPAEPTNSAGEPTTGVPGKVTDLIVTDSSSTSVVLAFTEVDDGHGLPADYALRTHVGPMEWGSAEEVTHGTCAAPLQGKSVGSRISCTIENLQPDTPYTFQVAAFRGTFQAGAVYGDLSNVVPDMSDEPESTSGNASYPNEPSGLSTIASVDFTNGINAQTGECTSYSAHNLSYLTNDGSTPSADGSVIRLKFPSGENDGTANGRRFDCWGPSISEGGANHYAELYVSYWIRIDGSDFQNQTVGTKIYYVAYGSTNRNNHSTMTMAGQGSQTIMSEIPPLYWISEMNGDGSDPGGSAIKYNANVNSEKLIAGQWQQVEAYYKINDINPTADNGELKIWIDGVQTHHLTGLRYRSDMNPLGFYHLQFTPVYGGSSGDVRTRDDYWRIDNLRISAR